MNNFCVAVPCKAYIKKYFCSLYGDPVDLDLKTDFGDTIVTKISGKPLTRINKSHLTLAFNHFDSQLKFQLPIDFYYRVKVDPSRLQVFGINQYLERVFDADLFLVITHGIGFGIDKSVVIEAFLQKYNILLDEDISYDAIRKKHIRMMQNPTIQNHFLVCLAKATSKLNLRA